MPYTILIERTSSDSFSSERRQDELPIVWNDLSRAKESLRRIRELCRIDAIVENDSYQSRMRSRKQDQELSEKLWKATYLPEKDKQYASVSMMLPLDDGTEQRIGTFWRGWGERLHCATIIEVADEDMRFCPEELPYDWWKDDE